MRSPEDLLTLVDALRARGAIHVEVGDLKVTFASPQENGTPPKSSELDLYYSAE